MKNLLREKGGSTVALEPLTGEVGHTFAETAPQQGAGGSSALLEQTILQAARDTLADMKYYAGEPRTRENVSAFFGYWQRINAFAYIGKRSNSGLSEPAVRELQRIDSEAAAVFDSYGTPRTATKEAVLSNASTTLILKDQS